MHHASLLFSAALAATAAALVAGVYSNGAGAAEGFGVPMAGPRSVLGGDLAVCSTDPLTGFMRNGRCETGPTDYGTHTVCARVTRAFLDYTMAQGNDLVTPRPEYQFPGLKEGDGWCLCASRWADAMRAGVAPQVVLEATHEKTLQFVGLDALQRHAAS